MLELTTIYRFKDAGRLFRTLWGGLAVLLLLTACAAPVNERTADASLEMEEETVDAACAYFYYLWGKSAELNQRYEEAQEAYEKVLLCDPVSDYVLRELGLVLIKMGKNHEALERFKEFIAGKPDDIDVRLLLADLYSSMGKNDEAVETYNGILAISEDEQALLMLGTFYFQKHQYDKAREILDRLVRQNAYSYLGYYYLAQLYRELRLITKALDAYEKALTINWSARLATEVAEYYEQQERYDDAIRLYRQVVEDDATNDQARVRLVNTYLATDRPELALAELQEFRKVADDPYKVDLIISRVLLAEDKFDEAITVLAAVLAQEPELSAHQYMMGLAYYKKGDLAKAAELLAMIPPTAAEYENSVLMGIRIFQEEDDVPGAIASLEGKLADANTKRMRFFVALATLYKEQGQQDRAMGVLNSALLAYPDSADLRFDYGVFLETVGDQEGAIGMMREVLALDPKNAAALNYIGYTWADNGVNLDQALEYIEKAVALRPEDGFIRDSLGWVHYKRDNLEQAVIELERAVEMVSGDPVIYDHLGEVYQHMGATEKALAAYEQALKLADDEEKKEAVRLKIEQLTAK